jgi:hypothetical protein
MITDTTAPLWRQAELAVFDSLCAVTDLDGSQAYDLIDQLRDRGFELVPTRLLDALMVASGTSREEEGLT